MLDSSATELLTKIGATLGALTALVAAIIKVGGIVTRQRGSDRKEDRANFESINDRLEEENVRLRSDLVSARKQHAEDLEECRDALEVRRQQMHEMVRVLARYQLEDDIREHPEQPEPADPNEDGDPK